MKRPTLALLFLLSSPLALAKSISCSEQGSLGGDYETEVAKGFTPNKLTIRRASDGSSYLVTLDSHWAPKAFDDGTLGTVGNFKGELIVPPPWSCVALVEIREKDDAEGLNGPTCFLLLRFVDASKVEVSTLGHCEYFHGDRATPAGTYLRVGT